MTIHWVYLLAGLFFALLPGRYLRGKECRHFEYEQLMRRLSEKSRRRRRWWKLPAVWIDPVRGFMAVLALREGLQAGTGVSRFEAMLPTLLIIGVLSVGVTLQCQGNHEKKQLVAPVGFMGGLMLAWFPLAVGLPSVVFGFASAVAFRRWSAGFMLGSVTTFALGFFFMNRGISLVWGAGIVIWPVILAWFLRRSLVLPVRN